MTKKGYTLSAEIKKRMSKAQKKRFENDRIWNYGRPWTWETKKAISDGMLKYWSKMNEEQRQIMRDRLRSIAPYNGNNNKQ